MDLRAFLAHRSFSAGGSGTKTKRKKLLLVMKLTAFILLAGMLHVSAAGWGQTVTLSEKNVPVQQVFKEISRQTGISILYNEQFLAGLSKVSIDVKDATVEQVLALCLKDQPLTYSIQNNKILIQQAGDVQSSEPPPPPIDIHGRVTDSLGNPLGGASVIVKGSKKGTTTNPNGEFILKNIKDNVTLIFSYTGFEKEEYKTNGLDNVISISLKHSTNPLDQVQVIAYGTITHRLNTGDVTTVTAKDIEQQPVANALAALEGRVPGLVITQLTGLPGGGFKVQIQGQNSILNGTDPFYIVDGVPYNSQMAGTLNNAQLQGGSPLNFINPYDIESIEILKDADATAIYGSRAANGAILITTKRGKIGPMKLNVNVKSGFSNAINNISSMNTQQYLIMRHQAFNNDGVMPGPADHDINGDWDTTRYTNWNKVLTQNTAHFTDANLTLSGGNANTQYLVTGGYFRQSTGAPTLLASDGADQRASVNFNLNSTSANKKFRFTLGGNYAYDKNTVQSTSFNTLAFGLPPDAPAIFNADGSLNWAPLKPGELGTWTNPYSNLYVSDNSSTSNLISNLGLSYSVCKGLDLRINAGYTNTQTDEYQLRPTTSYDPGRNISSGTSIFNEISNHSWIIEPQAEYKIQIGSGVVSALMGGTFQGNNGAVTNLYATGFISDALLNDVGAASNVYPSSNAFQYKYEAIFGRINYNLQDKYLINLTVRRDGSSRFGPDNRFANFGAMGAAWIFSKENFIEENFKFLSFGKIRLSYGSTGNDQVGNYSYLDLYNSTSYPYQGSLGLFPANLLNPNLAWELTKKFEGGLELGFLKDRLLLQVNFYQNRSSNQLVQTPTSQVTGFSQIQSNLPATVQNSGLEFLINSVNIKSKNFTWSSSLNMTIARNKLVSFPNLSTSSYSDLFIVGQPISIIRGWKYAGVNDSTGLYQFASKKGGNTSSPLYPDDYNGIVNTAPIFYGGFQNTILYKGFSLDFLFQFTKQMGRQFWASYAAMPGTMANQPTNVLDNWKKQGDEKNIQKFSQTYGDANDAFSNARNSDMAYGDASFIRLKNIALYWQIPASWRSKMHMESFRVFIQGQNVFTITNYYGFDPESQGYTAPPVKTWVAGLQFSL